MYISEFICLVNIVCSSCTGTKENGNLEGEGSANFHDGHSYQVERCDWTVHVM